MRSKYSHNCHLDASHRSCVCKSDSRLQKYLHYYHKIYALFIIPSLNYARAIFQTIECARPSLSSVSTISQICIAHSEFCERLRPSKRARACDEDASASSRDQPHRFRTSLPFRTLEWHHKKWNVYMAATCHVVLYIWLAGRLKRVYNFCEILHCQQKVFYMSI